MEIKLPMFNPDYGTLKSRYVKVHDLLRRSCSESSLSPYYSVLYPQKIQKKLELEKDRVLHVFYMAFTIQGGRPFHQDTDKSVFGENIKHCLNMHQTSRQGREDEGIKALTSFLLYLVCWIYKRYNSIIILSTYYMPGSAVGI